MPFEVHAIFPVAQRGKMPFEECHKLVSYWGGRGCGRPALSHASPWSFICLQQLGDDLWSSIQSWIAANWHAGLPRRLLRHR